MKPDEVISAAHDGTRGMPRERVKWLDGVPRGRASASVWGAQEAEDFEAPYTWGAYPKGFIEWACRVMQCRRERVVHLFSGTIPAGEGALRVDLRRDMRPDVVADCRQLPLPDACAAAVMIDPPYSVEYARDLYDTEYPRPSHFMAEASRIAKPGAPIGVLHFLVVKPAQDLERDACYGITMGPNYRIRAFTVYRKRQAQLFSGDREP